MKKYKLLVVDDDQDFLNVMKTVLKYEKRIDVDFETNPIVALDMLKAGGYDMLFVDYFMPQMTGEKMVENLREFNKDLFIILQTGYSGNKPADKMLENMNIQGYFDKSESFDKFLLLIKSTVKTLDLIEIIKQKDAKIDFMTYKDNLMGKLTEDISDGLKNQIASVDTMVEIFDESEIEKAKEILPMIKNTNIQMRNLLKALNFSSRKDNDLNVIKDNVMNLTRIRVKVSLAKLEIEVGKQNYTELDSTITTIVLIELVNSMLEASMQEMKININSRDNNCLEIVVDNVKETIVDIVKAISLPDGTRIEIESYENKQLKFCITDIEPNETILEENK